MEHMTVLFSHLPHFLLLELSFSLGSCFLPAPLASFRSPLRASLHMPAPQLLTFSNILFSPLSSPFSILQFPWGMPSTPGASVPCHINENDLQNYVSRPAEQSWASRATFPTFIDMPTVPSLRVQHRSQHLPQPTHTCLL